MKVVKEFVQPCTLSSLYLLSLYTLIDWDGFMAAI